MDEGPSYPDLEEDNDDYGGEEPGEPENGTVHPAYGIDQSTGPLAAHTH